LGGEIEDSYEAGAVEGNRNCSGEPGEMGGRQAASGTTIQHGETAHHREVAIFTDNTVQDGPAWTISTTRRFPTSATTGFYRAKRAEQEYLIFLFI